MGTIILNEIKGRPGSNPGGTTRLYLIPARGVKKIPAATSGKIIEDLQLNFNYAFKGWEFLPGKCRLANPTSGEQGSSYFETSIDVTIPRDDYELIDMFSSMLNGHFIAILDQASKRVKLAGSLNVPLICRKADIDFGSDTADLNGTVFQFRGRLGPALEYAGSIETTPITPLLLNLVGKTDVSTNGGSDGAFTVAAAGGKIPYSYSVGVTTQNNGTFTGKQAGNYTVTVTDAWNNTASLEVPITQPSARPKAWRAKQSSAYCIKSILEP